MPETQNIIKNFLANPDNLQKIKNVLVKHNLDNQESLNEMIRQLISGDLDTSLIGDYLISEFEINFKDSQNISDELLDEVLFEIDDELEENYENKQKELGEFEDKYLNLETEVEDVDKEREATQPTPQPTLLQTYNQFISSSLFQNILASQGQMREKYFVNNNLDDNNLKNDFYAAINAGDKIKVVGILRLLAELGKLRESFGNDKRYVEFFGGVLDRHQGPKEKENFLNDPANEKYLIDFLQFILEKRLDFSVDESAMIGTGLGSLARRAGNEEYDDIAYGDEGKDKFMWSS